MVRISRPEDCIMLRNISQKKVWGYLVFPVKKWVPSDVSRILIQSGERLSRGFINHPVDTLGVNVRERCICSLVDGRRWNPLKFLRKGVTVIMNASILLSDSPPVQDLIAGAVEKDIACCGMKSGRETLAFALSCKKYLKVFSDLRQMNELWTALTHLTACMDDDPDDIRKAWNAIEGFQFFPPGKTFAENSTAMIGVKDSYCRSGCFASKYTNLAFREILSHPEDRGYVGQNPTRMAEALTRQRDTSRVPWIFNALINEIEYRLGASEPTSFPLEIHLSMTGACNIECRFCGYTHDIARNNFVRLSQVENLDFLRHAQTLRLHSGHGEPTLNKHLPEIINSVSERFPHLGMNFFSNGISLHQPGLFDSLIGSVRWINASINAATRDSWKYQCKADQFEKVCANLRTLLKIKRSRRSLLPLVFGSMVLNQVNLDDLPLMPSLCRKLGIDRFTAFAYSALGYDSSKKFGSEMALEACRSRYDRIYMKTLLEAKTHGISVELPPPSDEVKARFGLESRLLHDFAGVESNEWPFGRFLDSLDFDSPPYRFCHFLWRYAAIGSTYNIGHSAHETHYLYPCIGPLGGVDFSRRTAFRFPKEKDFLNLWQNPVLVHLRRAQCEQGICKVCDICRYSNSRDPKLFKCMENLVGEFSQRWR